MTHPFRPSQSDPAYLHFTNLRCFLFRNQDIPRIPKPKSDHGDGCPSKLIADILLRLVSYSLGKMSVLQSDLEMLSSKSEDDDPAMWRCHIICAASILTSNSCLHRSVKKETALE